jgi:hypothetical protein
MKLSLTPLTRIVRSIGYGTHPRPARDWLVLLTLWMVLFAASILSNVWYFRQASLSNPIGTSTTAETESLDLTDVRTLFIEREVMRVQYLSGPAPQDPAR